MAYMSQERKKEIAANLKTIMPHGWKYSLSVEHHSTLRLTVQEAPVNLVTEYVEKARQRPGSSYDTHDPHYIQVNPYWIDNQFEGERLEQMKAIVACLNDGNHDRSDAMSDYFDVGWYVSVNFGRYDRPFRVAA